MAEPIEMLFGWLTRVSPMRWVSRSPQERGTFEGDMCLPKVSMHECTVHCSSVTFRTTDKLPTSVVSAENIQTFKKLVKRVDFLNAMFGKA